MNDRERGGGPTSAAPGIGVGAGRRPAFSTMLARGLRRQCPWCGGSRAFFDGWFAKAERCHRCGLSWRRGDVGFELGAAAVAAILTLAPLVGGLIAMIVMLWPDLPIATLVVVLGVGAGIGPIVAYPLSYTVWQAIDIMMRPVTPDHFE